MKSVEREERKRKPSESPKVIRIPLNRIPNALQDKSALEDLEEDFRLELEDEIYGAYGREEEAGLYLTQTVFYSLLEDEEDYDRPTDY